MSPAGMFSHGRRDRDTFCRDQGHRVHRYNSCGFLRLLIVHVASKSAGIAWTVLPARRCLLRTHYEIPPEIKQIAQGLQMSIRAQRGS